MADKDLQYKISTVADTKGADATTAALKKTDAAAKETGKTAEQGNAALKQQAEITGNLSAGANVLGEVMRGNLRALGQFPAVLRAIAVAASANPLFALGAIASATVLPAMAKIKAGWDAQGAAAKEAAKHANDALEAARDAVAEKRRNETADQFEAIASAAERAKREIQAVTQAQIERIDREEAAAVAEFRDRAERGGLSSAQTAAGVADLGRRFAAVRDAAALQGIDQRVERSRRAAAEAGAAVPGAEEGVASAERARNQVAARSPQAIAAELAAAEDEARRRVPILREAARNLLSSSEERERRAGEADQIEQRLSDLRAEQAEALENYAARNERAEARLDAARAALAAATEKAARLAQAAADDEASGGRERESITGAASLRSYRSALEVNSALRKEGLPERATPASPYDAGRFRAEESALAAKTSEAAGKIEKAQERASGGVIEFAGQTYKALNGILTKLNQQDETIRAQARQIERLSARIDNLKNSTQ